jgi:hypothetical protein
VTAAGFRKLALAFPGAEPSEHMGHPDFRVGGKVFATLGYPDRKWAMVRLTPDQQEMYMGMEPEVFVPAAGAWGLRGATCVRLEGAPVGLVRDALGAAWENTTPKPKARAGAPARRKPR